MADELIARFRRWFEYEQDVHAKVLESLATVPNNCRSGPEYRKAVNLFAHIVAGRRIWLGRLGVLPPATGSLFPNEPDVIHIAAQWEAVRSAWVGYLAGLTDTDLGAFFEYQSLDAGRFRSRVEDILAQLFGHSWYHRGQIAMLIRAAGGTPAITDLVFWSREAISPPTT
jgi:uncharacterized damage-inducible protein DinB